MTPDWSATPKPVPYARLGDPQSLNLYSYVRNNPTSFYDPDGHCLSWAQALCNFGQSRLTGYGVQWRSLTEQYLDSTGIFREAVISILAVIAKQKRIRLSERTRAGLAQPRRKRKILGRPRVKLSGDAVRQLRTEGLSWSAIAGKLGVARSTAQLYAKPQKLGCVANGAI